ncbi:MULTISPECIES: hypothetical protein [unclassified Meiothermus]|uniref:hypothetical protein n=1 Tax=unclassified Meiothermus TaxID=370471 RepID=UPI00101EC905|nr:MULTISPECIES: hypothetical protein [unclassified Meiothermus]RYM38926.1 hypothetical protein EWH23_04135 [Meiothermus sp. PNK-Is4]
MNAPFISPLDRIRHHAQVRGHGPEELRHRATICEKLGHTFMAELYRDEAEVRELLARLARSAPCGTCGGTGRVAWDIPCWRCVHED